MQKVICSTASKSRGNPGPSAIGVFIVGEDGEVIKEVAQTIGNASSNFAEYYGVMVGLQNLSTLFGAKTKTMDFELRLESELVKKQLNNESEINDPGLVPMFIEIHNMCVAAFPQITFVQVSTMENKAAVELAHNLLDGVR